MKTEILIVIGMIVLVLLVLVFIGYKIGTGDQKYERDTGRDFASNRDKDFGGGGMYGGGYGSGYGRPRTRSYDDDPYDLNAPIDNGAADDTAERDDDGEGYVDFPDEPRAPEF